ncbi:uncharacterized protein LOC120626909 [Pararge aegeria]|nr:uncharacterized protein LOC120626909 [Pararge aegeria]
MTSRHHNHSPPNSQLEHIQREENPDDTAVVITSRKGKEMLLFHKYTYRKQYATGGKTRWVCSTKKNCHAVVFTNSTNIITSALEAHNHDPPKYYLKPNNLLEAIRQPLLFESE